MLNIAIDSVELFDESKSLLFMSKSYKLTLEHSLISLSKWESKWHKAFLTKLEKTPEETLDYIRCMTINKDVDEEAYKLIDKKLMDQINQYILDSMTATTFSEDDRKKPTRQTITSELIYFWMINYSIPFECEKWHLNRLLTLIKTCAVMNQPKGKTNQKELLNRNLALNEERLRQYNTTG